MCPDILQSTSHGEEQEQAEMGHPRRETERPCSPGALVATLLTLSLPRIPSGLPDAADDGRSEHVDHELEAPALPN